MVADWDRQGDRGGGNEFSRGEERNILRGPEGDRSENKKSPWREPKAMIFMVGMRGFEPPAPCSRSRCANLFCELLSHPDCVGGMSRPGGAAGRLLLSVAHARLAQAWPVVIVRVIFLLNGTLQEGRVGVFSFCLQ